MDRPLLDHATLPERARTRTCVACTAPATARHYRDGEPRAYDSCDDHRAVADSLVGGTQLLRPLP